MNSKNWLHVCVIALLAFSSVLAFSFPAASAEGGYAFVTEWGSLGSGNGDFKYPYGVAVDSSGNVFVADTQNDRIQKFDSSGTFIIKWGSTGTANGSFDTPKGIAVDSSGNVFVADTNNHRIQKFNSSGTFITKWGSYGSGNGYFKYPYGVAVDSSGNVFVADTNNHRIQKFNSSGTFITKWGSRGSGDRQFVGPNGVAVDSSGNVFVADTQNDRIQKFNSSGTFITKWGSRGSGNGDFKHPYSVAVDSSGNVFVADTSNDRIQKFDYSGTFITKWGSPGSGDGQFDLPRGVAVDSSGNVFVADTDNYRIQKFMPVPAISVTKTASPSSGAPSTNVNFTIVVSNTGSFALDPVKVVDTLPGGMSYVSSSPTADSHAGSAVTWNNFGHISAFSSKTIYLIAHIDVGSGTLNNSVNATGKPPTGDNVSDEAYAEVTVLQPDITVTKTASPSSGAPSTNVNFSITVTNNGETDLDPVKVVDTLPSGLSYVNSYPKANDTSGPIVWNNVGSLASGDTKTLYLIAHIDVGSGTLNNSVNATGKSPTGDNVSDEAYAEVTAVQPSIQVTKTASPTSGAPSTNVNFTITVTNNGETDLDPVKVVDTLPAGMSYVDSYPKANDTSGPIVWNNLGPLAACGGTTTLYLIAHIDVGSGTLNNSVNATGKPPTGDNVSDEAYAEVTAVQPSIQVTKTASPTSGAPSTNVNFTITVTNNGETNLDPVKVVDTLPSGLSYVNSYPKANDTSGPTVWNNVGPLAATSGTTTLYLIAHIDVGSGTLNNSVNATGKPPTGDNVSDDAYAEVTAVQPSIQVTKTASPSSGAPSTNVNFTITVTNNGETNLDPVKVVDTLPSGLSYVNSYPKANDTSGPIVWNNVGPLAASGGTTTLYLIAHIDVGASGSLNNTITVTGKPPHGDIVSAAGYAVVSALEPAISITKTASPSSGAPSTNVNFTIVVSNTGDCTLDPVKVVDMLPADMSYVSSSPAANDTSGPIVWNNVGSLASGGTKTLYLVAHVDAGASGSLNNTITVTGKPPDGDIVSAAGYAVVAALEPAISVSKTASPSAGAPSTNVYFTIVVSNTGDCTLDPVKVVDTLPADMSYVSSSPAATDTSGPIVWNNVGSLASGDTKTLYLVAHVDAGASGSLNNTITVTGKPPDGDIVSAAGYAVVAALEPAISVSKTASPSAGAPSTNVYFTIVVSNTGDCALDPVKVVDTLPADMSYVSSSPAATDTSGPIVWNNVGSLASGDTKTLYLVAHVDAGASGSLNNTITVTGKPPDGDIVSAAGYAVVSALEPGIAISKTASPSSGAPSTNVNFTIVVSNTGDCALDPVKVIDMLPADMSYVSSSPAANDTSGPIVWNNVGSLASGDTKTLYLVAHVDAGASGSLNNTITVTGKPPDGDIVSAAGYAVVSALEPAISVTKTASPSSGAPSTNVNFTIVVSNTGDCALDPVKVVDMLPADMSYVSSSPAANDTSGPIVWNNVGSLASGDTKTLYLVAHVDAGSGTLNNSVNATGKSPTGDNVSDEAYAEVTAVQPSIQVTKVASPTSGAPSTNVNFTITVTNNGETDLDPVKVVDTLPSGLSYVNSYPKANDTSGPTVWNNVGPLASGDTKTLYLIAHVDVGSGTLNNSVNATGKSPTGDNVSDEAYAEVTAVQPSIQVTKTASPSSGAPSTNVNFTITVTNNGETDLDPVKVVDTLPSGLSYVNSYPKANDTSGPTVWNNVGPLAASGGTTTLYLIAHIDVGSGTLNNSVNATGKPPTGDNVSDEAYAEVTALQPDITVTKAASPTSGAPSTNVNFSITVTNNGETALDPVKVVDTLPEGMSYVNSYPKANDTSGPIVWNNAGSLASGDTKTLYLIAHIDVGSGTLNNSVNATGKSPTGDNVSDEAYAEVTAVQPSIQVSKTASPSSGAPSTNVYFTITVTNNGETNLDPVKVVDTLPSGLSYVNSYPKANDTTGPTVWNNVGPLAASGGTTTLYLIAHIDVGASGSLNNTITVTGKPPHGDIVSAAGYAVVSALEPAISITKTASPTSGAPSTNVNFTIVVSNTGDCTLDPVKVVDMLPADMSYVSSSPAANDTSGPIVWNNVGSLASGDTKTLYLVAHVDAGASDSLNNTITVTGKPPDGDIVSAAGYAVVSALEPAISVSKTASPSSGAPSTNVNFTIVVSNTGDCTLDPVKVVDTLPADMSYVSSSPAATDTSGPIVWNNVGSLASGDTKTLYLVAQVDAGASDSLNNTITVTGKPPDGDIVSAAGYAVVSALEPGISVTKVGNVTEGAPSTIVNYTITVNNLGDCALNVTAVDTLPVDMSYVKSTGTESPQGTITWNLGTLAAQDSTTVYLEAHIDDGASGVLNNTVHVEGKPLHGDIISADTYYRVTALTPGISVIKTASPTEGEPGTNVTFTINVTNTGDCILDPVRLEDELPAGMSYRSSDPPADAYNGVVTWTNVGPLAAGRSKTILLVAQIDEESPGVLNNSVNATGSPAAGDNVFANDTAQVITIRGLETATGTGIAYLSINAGLMEDLKAIGEYTLPEEGKPYLGFPHGFFSFNITGLTPGQTVEVTLTLPDNVPVGTQYWKYHASEGGWIRIPMGSDDGDNVITITLVDGGLGDDDGIADGVIVDQGGPGVPIPWPELTKSAPTSVAPGGTISYTILYSNPGLVELTEVTITENYPVGVTFVSAVPAPDPGTDNIWSIGTLRTNASGTITITVKVPESRELTFTESGSVTGEGFVMVSKDLSTEQKPYTLKNVVTISCAETDPVSASASTTVGGVPGTSLSITEHGSGIYESEEILNLETKNKSISLEKSTEAEYKPTAFNFSDGFAVNFTNKWMQDICSKNMVLGDAMHKKIKDATYIKDDTKTETGEYGTEMAFVSSFYGAAHIGAVSKDVTTSEDYIGEFELFWAAKEECQYLFNWSRVPGNDSENLIRFLVDTLDIIFYWAENATITKSDDDRIINISTDGRSAEVILAANNETATVKVGNETIYVLDVRTEDGSLNLNLNVYDCRLREISESVVGEGYVMVDKELTSGHIQVVEHGSGIYSSDTDFDSQRLNKSTEAEYQPTTFNFSDGFSVNFSSNWMQGICAKDKKAGTAIHKKISNAASIADDTTATKSSMAFETSFNGSIHVGARATGTRISEDYIGVFNLTEKIEIGKVVIVPTATPVPDWLPCPFPEPGVSTPPSDLQQSPSSDP